MKHPFSVARCAACLLLAMTGVHARAQQTIPAAADPQAAVPATRYQPALNRPHEAAPAATPDRNWVASNQTVAATNSMALTMKPMGGQTADPHAGHTTTAPASADPHAGHPGMHGMGMDKQEGGGMCAPAGAGDKAGQGMQCMSGDKSGDGKMSCCASGCQSCCCKDKMKKKETS